MCLKNESTKNVNLNCTLHTKCIYKKYICKNKWLVKCTFKNLLVKCIYKKCTFKNVHVKMNVPLKCTYKNVLEKVSTKNVLSKMYPKTKNKCL